jgi:hypothetical protein
MADEVRVWQINRDDSLDEMDASTLNREERIEKWITQNISVLEPDKSSLLVIGEQVQTDFGKRIDLLCIDSKGDLAIVELKRDKTAREVTAQALDYASWVKDLGLEKIEEIAAGYLKNGKKLKEAFEETFPEAEFPDVINADHSIKIVASEVDDSTERIIRYLSERGVNINWVRFQMFRAKDGREFLVRTFTIPPEEAEQNTRRSGKTKRASARKTLETRLEECENDAEREFLVARIKNPQQEKTNHRDALLYRFAGKVRYRARARIKHLHVIQMGRFANDMQFWRDQLSIPDIGLRHGGAHISFTLVTRDDFDFFQSTMDNEAKSFLWSNTSQANDENAEEEDDTE